MKKTWIKIKRGLLRPEHRERLGVRVCLFMYMLDKVDWDTGHIYGWKDKDEAEDFGMQWRTLQKQRQEIEEEGYITCIKRKYSQEIIIHKWTNPREYSGEEYNQEVESTPESTQVRVLSNNNGNESTPESTPQSLSKLGTPTYSSQITNHIKKEELKSIGGAGFYILDLVGYDYNDADDKTKAEISKLIDIYGEEKLCEMAHHVKTTSTEIRLAELLKKIAAIGPFYESFHIEEPEKESFNY